MELKNNEFFKMTLDGSIHREVQDYCAKYLIDENEFVNIVLRRFFKENKKIQDTMSKGYMEMSHINLDICNEFEESEKDLSPHL